jgi:hypothetical protein
MMASFEKRVQALEKRFAEPGGAHARGPNPDTIAVLDELAALRASEAVHHRGGVPIETGNIPQKILGDNYTRREFRELAVSRALKKRGYSEAEVAERMPHYLAEFEHYHALIAD